MYLNPISTRVATRGIAFWRTTPVLILLSLLTMFGTAQAQLSGTYTIGPSGNYTSITAAIAALNSVGVSDAVTFTIASGTYAPPTAGWVINAIAGASATNRITFKPAADATVVISGDIGGYVGATFILNGTKYLTFDGSNSGGADRSMTIRNTNINYMGSHYLRNGAQFNVVKNCILQGNGSSMSIGPTGYGPIIFIGGTTGTAGNDSNLFQNNTIGDPSGTYRSGTAILMAGQSTTYPNKGNKFIGNDIVNFGHNTSTVNPYGVYHYYYNAGTVFQGNEFHMTAPAAYGYMYGIYHVNANGYSPNITIDGNKFYKMWSNYNSMTYHYGIIYVNDQSNTATNLTRITNNMITVTEDMNIGGYPGIYYTSSSSNTNCRADILNNSIHWGGVDPVQSNSIFPAYLQTSGGSSGPYIYFRNNAINNVRSGGYMYGVGYYAGTNPNNLYANYNLLNTMSSPASASYIGLFNGSAYTTLAAWKSGSLKDSNSIMGNPQYVDPATGNLHINTSARTPVSDAGQPFGGVTTDIDGDTRSTSVPDIGADEGSFLGLLGNDMMALALINPKLPPFNTVRGSTAFSPQGRIYNTGLNAASSFTVRMKFFNSSGGVSYEDVQTISSLASVTAQLITFNQTGNVSGSTSLTPGNYTVEFRVIYGSDQDTSNNAIYSAIIVKNPLCGSYTINPGAAASASNYQTFTSAIADINALGVTCAVTFLVSGGSYSASTEIFPIVLNAPASITASNNVTFKPAAGANVIVTGSAAGGIFLIDQGDYYVLDGSNATNGTTRNWTIENTGSGPAVKMTNGASYNTVKNMSMRANNSSVGYSTAGGGIISLEFTSTTYLGNSYNVIRNNLVGDTTATIRSGIGIHLYSANLTSSATYESTANVIDGNDVVNFGFGTQGWGINMYGYSVARLKIFRNKVHMTNTNNSANLNTIYGMFDYQRYYATGHDTIAYNQVYDLHRVSYANPNIYPVYMYYSHTGESYGTSNYSFHNNLIVASGYNVPYAFYVIYTYASTTIAHNTIDLSATNGSYGIVWQYNYGTSAFKNNIFRRTTASNYLFYFYYVEGSGYGTFSMDRNIYSAGTTTQNWQYANPSGSWSGTVSGTSLASWQSTMGYDANSVMQTSIPFINPSNLDYHIDPQPIFAGEGRGQALGYTNDLDGDARDMVAPDIGADEGDFNGGGIRVVSPNGGEQITVGSPFTITFTTNRPMAVRVEMSTNGGQTWGSYGIVNPTNNGTNNYVINAPDTVVNNARVRVMSAKNAFEGDTSDAVFNLVRPILVVVAPNGGERLTPTDTTKLQWTSQYITPSMKVQVDYSTDGGATWLPIVTDIASANLPATNSIDWIIPNTPSTNARMRVKLVGNVINDVSNNSFVITPMPNVRITSPNGGEQWFVGEKRNVTWTAIGMDYVRMDYSIDGGANWLPVLNRIPAYLGSYEWTLPNTPTTDAILRLINVERPRFWDQSDDVFAILASTLQVISPNGGEKYNLNQPVQVLWAAYNVTTARIDYSSNNGVTWYEVGQANGADGSFTFTPNPLPTKLGRVRVVNVDRQAVQDISDQPFEIMAEKSITVYTPGESESFVRGSTTVISWSAPRVNSVNIQYSSNGGGTWTNVVSNVPAAQGSYTWTVPNQLTTQGLIRLTEVGGSTFGESGKFSIVDQTVSTLRVIAPNGGEQYTVGDPINVRWTVTPDITSIGISYSSDGGTTWKVINSNVMASQGQYGWVAPNNPGTMYQVRVDASSISDASDGNFEVMRQMAPMLTVLSPNGGENLTIGTVVQLTWSSQDIVSTVTVSYSTDNGGKWQPIGTVPATPGTINWTVPNQATTQALVRVASDDFSAMDQSNGTFTISEEVIAPIKVTSPNLGSEVWKEGQTYAITWDGPSDITQVAIEHSTDGGVSWLPIASSASVEGSNSYNWTIGAGHWTTSALVKVKSSVDGNRYDVSDNTFTIERLSTSVPNLPVTGLSSAELIGNFPNPFASRTLLRWVQASSSAVMVRVYEGSGRLVSYQSVGVRESGEQSYELQAGDLANGLYYYEIEVGMQTLRGMMMIVR